jgi:hypothetical protein
VQEIPVGLIGWVECLLVPEHDRAVIRALNRETKRAAKNQRDRRNAHLKQVRVCVCVCV